MKSRASKSARLLLAAIVLTSFIGCDQATKRLATERLRDAPAQSYLAGMLRLQYTHNPGGFLSVGEGLSQQARFVLFTLGNVAFLAVIACFVARRWNMRLTLFVGALLLLAGGVGNLIDRVLHQGLGGRLSGGWQLASANGNYQLRRCRRNCRHAYLRVDVLPGCRGRLA
jgi:signal peptidase II